MANVFVSMPCVGGNIHQKTVITLDHITRKHSLNLHYIENCSLVTKARQDHFGMFLKSKDDYLLSVDADLVLGPPEILDDMVERCPENAVIGGLYAMKALTMEGKCVFNGTQYDKSKKIELNGDLLRMKYIPNGFLLMPRKIALLLTEKYQDLKYIDNQIGETYAVYNTMLIADD